MRSARPTRGPKRGSGERSNAWSDSRYTNLTPFDPFDSEVQWLNFKGRPSLVVPVNGRGGLSIFARPIHAQFLRPFEPSDIAGVLAAVPPEFLHDLEGVHLLGGSLKQARAASSNLFHYGCYGMRRIYLHAFPRRLLRERRLRAPRPSVQHEMRRFGVKITEESGGCSIEFSEPSIRIFYLYNVLLHELGHHLDRYNSGDRRSRERYANWFAEEQAKRLLEVASAE